MMIDLNKQRETVHNAINTLFDIAKVQKAEIDMLNVDVANKQAEIEALKAKLAKYENKMFFSHDFNGDGFKYHDTLEEAKKEAEAGLDWYRDRVAGGHHVEDDGEFKELCFGVVLASADYNVDEVVTKEHHMNDEWTQYEVGTEILSLDFYEEPVKPSQENGQ